MKKGVLESKEKQYNWSQWSDVYRDGIEGTTRTSTKCARVEYSDYLYYIPSRRSSGLPQVVSVGIHMPRSDRNDRWPPAREDELQ